MRLRKFDPHQRTGSILSKVKTTNFFDLALLKRVLRFASPYKKRFYFSIVLSIVLALFTPVRPYLIQRTVDTHIAGHDYSWVVIITIIQTSFS